MDTIRLQINDEDAKQELKWKKEYPQAVLRPVVLNEELLKSYTGTYGSREILLLDDGLYMQRKDKSKFQLMPINDHTFYIKELNYRLQYSI
jgi:hypothetical protein